MSVQTKKIGKGVWVATIAAGTGHGWIVAYGRTSKKAIKALNNKRGIKS